MKTTGTKMYLHQGEKKVMTSSRIDCVWLINYVNWPIRALFAWEVVKKALKKGKNNILHARLGHMSKTYNKKIVLIVDNIDSNPTKICFGKSCIGAKIMRNPSTKLMSEVTTKLGRIQIDFWESFPNISLKINCYMWIATKKATK